MNEAEARLEAAVARIGKVATGDLSPVKSEEGGGFLFGLIGGGSGDEGPDPYAVRGQERGDERGGEAGRLFNGGKIRGGGDDMMT